ncbi:MAG: hypothetical protein EOM05_10280 [Clostridia bacterium]|nr:hypothetical protein [Clostridia bacterium]
MKNNITKFGFAILFAFISLFAVQTAQAQVPDAINFQAIARDGLGNVMPDTDIMIQLSILDGGSTGTQVYREIRSLTTNAYGSFSFQISRDAFMTEGEFTEIDWAGGDKYLKVDYDPSATLSFDLSLGTIEFVTVPYAFAAGDVTYIDLTGVQDGDILVYNDATGKFEPGSVNIPDLEWNNIQNKPDFATVATSGDYNDLLNKPTLFSGSFVDLTNKPTTIAGYGITDAVTTTGNQTIAGNKSFTGTTTVITPVNASDAVTKAYVDNLVSDLQAQIVQLTNIISPPFTDSRDGNVYHALTIGNQVWMAENLKYLPSVAGPGTGSGTTPYYYVYGYDGTNVTDAKATANYDTYGVLYNWPAAMAGSASSSSNPSGVQGVCPAGWHLPSDAEWTELTDYLGGESVAGGKLKETGTTHWQSPNTGATNETGFTALPGGYRYGTGNFDTIGGNGNWWSATESSTLGAWYRSMYSSSGEVGRYDSSKTYSFSVRCLKD